MAKFVGDLRQIRSAAECHGRHVKMNAAASSKEL
jgi:hypothetical protein